MAYAEKLRDPRWQKKRLEILERDNWQCKFCRETTKTLHVHHIKYSNGNPWEIDNSLLMTLCEECHQYETNYLKDSERELIELLKSKGAFSGVFYRLSKSIQNLTLKEIYKRLIV